MLTVTFAALMTVVLSNFWLLINVSYAVPLSPTPQLPTIKITSPHKSQQIRVGSNILVSGISSPPSGISHTGCAVSLNEAQPYQKTVAMGHGGKGDYSVWHYNIIHKYTSLKLGQNKMTGKTSLQFLSICWPCLTLVSDGIHPLRNIQHGVANRRQ